MSDDREHGWIEMKHPGTGGWMRCGAAAESIWNKSGWVRTLSSLIEDGDWVELARRTGPQS